MRCPGPGTKTLYTTLACLQRGETRVRCAAHFFSLRAFRKAPASGIRRALFRYATTEGGLWAGRCAGWRRFRTSRFRPGPPRGCSHGTHPLLFPAVPLFSCHSGFRSARRGEAGSVFCSCENRENHGIVAPLCTSRTTRNCAVTRLGSSFSAAAMSCSATTGSGRR